MLGIDLGDKQRNVVVHPMGLHVREHVVPGLRERGLPLLGRVGWERGEADLGVEIRRGRLQLHAGDRGRHLAGPVPRRDVAVALSGLSVARGERADLEPGMALQQSDEPLSDRPCRAEDRDLALAHRGQV
jgi:hypothetical protein